MVRNYFGSDATLEKKNVMDLLWTDCLEDGCLFVNKQTKKQLKNLYCIISDELVSLTQRICSSDEVMFFFGGGV